MTSTTYLAPYKSEHEKVLAVWDEFLAEREAWTKRLNAAIRTITKAQLGRFSKKDATKAWSKGGPNQHTHQIIGFEPLRVPAADPGYPGHTEPAPIPPGWRKLKSDVYLTPIPERSKDGLTPEAKAARALLDSIQPPDTLLHRFSVLCGMPTMVIGGCDDERGVAMHSPAMQRTDSGLMLLAWGTKPETVAESWADEDRGDYFEPILPSDYYALRGE